ncbi:hypothetical protein FIBSPDRAFT_488501 [Athelia psychrophila]|uniref:Uncharacterized protein n=1 Tax=Athelia psychrophila TaxID=1759441 RepID=A0A165WZY0_9AGAM|nr:hypothetical protein FIBSPDRAFT_270545 [Fibularhizoctonia sp. CBS 109695]KZP22197.1 hypothetical protein FIBSPDRAFT_488501 [Fibularhizoctonia sp. CBS 109695]
MLEEMMTFCSVFALKPCAVLVSLYDLIMHRGILSRCWQVAKHHLGHNLDIISVAVNLNNDLPMSRALGEECEIYSFGFASCTASRGLLSADPRAGSHCI